MPRLILFVALAVSVAYAAARFASEPGTLILTIRGGQWETSVGVAVLGVAALVIAAIVVFWLVSSLFGAPKRIRAWRRRRRSEKGLKALARGMVAVAAGDAGGASRQAKRAGHLLDAAPLTLLLSAQAAQLGDDRAAENYFREMLSRPDTEFLGLRGLLLQAGRQGDGAAALTYARRAAELRPDSSWVQRSVFELSVKAGLWADAEGALRRAIRRGAIDRETGARHRAAVFLQQSADAQRRDYGEEARNLARKAHRAAPEFIPAALRLATLEGEAGRMRQARRAIERAWRVSPHPELAAAYGAFVKAGEGESEESAALARVQGLRRLLEIRPGDPEGHLAMAEVALAAKLWGEARSHLDQAREYYDRPETAEEPPARLYRLYAQSEEEGAGDTAAAARWLGLAGEAGADGRWLCADCGHGYASWAPSCPGCQSFDTLHWGRPEPIARIAAGPGAPVPLELGSGARPPGPAPTAPAEGTSGKD